MTALSPDDYDAIESAVMETARGRWFLAEYARRNRHADTEMLLDAIERFAQVRAPEAARPATELAEMAAAIIETKAEIVALAPEDGNVGDAFDLVASGPERAAVAALAAAERIQEVAWVAREQGFDPDQCDELHAGATEIYAACAQKDLAARRIRKAVALLQRLEAAICPCTEIADVGAPDIAEEELPELISAVALAFDESGDAGMVTEAVPAQDVADELPATEAPLEPQPILLDFPAVDDLPAEAPTDHFEAAMPADPLAALRAMSQRERMQLFS